MREIITRGKVNHSAILDLLDAHPNPNYINDYSTEWRARVLIVSKILGIDKDIDSSTPYLSFKKHINRYIMCMKAEKERDSLIFTKMSDAWLKACGYLQRRENNYPIFSQPLKLLPYDKP